MTTTAAIRDLPWGPSPDGLDLPYWEGLAAGELRLQRCGQCRGWIWGPQPLCPSCHTFEPDWEAVDPVGTVYAWSRSHTPFIPDFADRLPYVTVLVELPHAGRRRVLGMLTGADGGIAVGDTVEGVFEHAPDERWPLLRWRLVPSTDTDRKHP